MAPDHKENTTQELAVYPADALIACPSHDVSLSGRVDSALNRQVTEALETWLVRTPSISTRENYSLDLK